MIMGDYGQHQCLQIDLDVRTDGFGRTKDSLEITLSEV